MCIFKARDVVNANEHSSHLNGLIPVCMRTCVFRPLSLVNIFKHSLHLKAFPSLKIKSPSVRFWKDSSGCIAEKSPP